MKRLLCLFVVISAAACSDSGSDTGEASLSNTQPPVMSSAAEPFSGPDGAGNMVLGWKILLFKDGPGAGCKEAATVGTIGIYTNMADGSGPQALLSTGSIPVVTMAPPMVAGAAAANASIDGTSITGGTVTITEFHLTADAKHADRIAGMINLGGTDTTLDGMFTAPICE